MSTTLRRLAPAALVLGVAILAGCATSKEAIDQAQATADEAKSAATAAQDSASDASRTAKQAQQTADAANSTANDAATAARQAQDTADTNKAAIDELNEKIDRMFKKSMRK